MATPHYSPVVGEGLETEGVKTEGVFSSKPLPQPPAAPKSSNVGEVWVDNFYARQFPSETTRQPHSPTVEEILNADQVGPTNWLRITPVFKKVL